MPTLIKNLFKIFFSNKKILISLIGLVLFFSLLPVHSAQALDLWPWDDVVNAVRNVFSYLTTLPIRIVVFVLALGLFIIALVLGLIFFFITTLLNWLITACLQVGITPVNPATPEIINIGWSFSRDLVNMLFILILVFIGLATILKLRDYEAKKTLPLLIIIALLVNFSGVIVGFFVDLGNILTNFFLKNTALSNIGNIWDLAWSYFSSSVVTVFTGVGDILTNIGEWVGIIVYGLILLFFYAFATFIYFVIMLIFLARVLILWILMILAPFAFACYILPATKRWWNQWWQQLIQWSIIGVPIGFFLWISSWMLTNMSTQTIFGDVPTFSNITEVTGITGMSDFINALAGLITSILGPCLALGLLAIGVMLSLQLAPSGAQGIINFGKKTGMTAGGWAARKGGSWARERVPKRVREAGKKIATYTPKSRAARAVGAPVWAIGRAMGRAVGPGIVTKEKETAKAAEKKWTGALYDRKVSEFLGATSNAERAGIISAFSEDDEVEKLLRDEKVKRVLTDDGKRRIAEKAGEIGEAKKVIPAFLPKGTKEVQENWLKEVGVKAPEAWEREAFKIETRLEKVVGRAKSANIKYFSSEALTGQGAQEAIHKFWTGTHIAEAAREFGKVFVDKFQEEGNERGMEWYEKNNKPLARYWYSTAAQGQGLTPPLRLYGDWTPPRGWKRPRGYIPGGPRPDWKFGDPIPEGWTPPPRWEELQKTFAAPPLTPTAEEIEIRKKKLREVRKKAEKELEKEK